MTRLPSRVAQAIRQARHVYLEIDDRYHDLIKKQWVRVSKSEAKRIMRMRPDEAEPPCIQTFDGGDTYISPGWWDREM
jgi:hypothetical protein